MGKFYGIARLDFITVLHRLINCSAPKTVFKNYFTFENILKCEVLSESIFFTNFFHKIVQRNVELTQEILNLDSKIKDLGSGV